mgnify:CR=1 FL=1
MTYGRQVGDKDSNFSEVRDYIRQYQYNDKEIIQEKPHYFCNNANSMIRKDLWVDHPFDEALTGLEDIEWSKYWMDQGYKVIYKPNACVIHIHNENSKQIRNRFWRESIAARSIGILSIRKILSEFPKQVIYSLRDTVFFFRVDGKGKLSDIFLYRFNRLIGTLKSITNKKPILVHSKLPRCIIV